MYHQYYDDWYLGDNYHPSTLASTHIADGIMDCIINGSTSVSRREELAEDVFITAAGATVTVNSCCPFLIVQENDVTTITPVLRSVNPAVKIEHNAAIFQISEGYEMRNVASDSEDIAMIHAPEDFAVHSQNDSKARVNLTWKIKELNYEDLLDGDVFQIQLSLSGKDEES